MRLIRCVYPRVRGRALQYERRQYLTMVFSPGLVFGRTIRRVSAA